MSKTIERPESQAMQDIRQARARIHDITKDMTFEQRREFFAKESKRFEEIAKELENRDDSNGKS